MADDQAPDDVEDFFPNKLGTTIARGLFQEHWHDSARVLHIEPPVEVPMFAWRFYRDRVRGGELE